MFRVLNIGWKYFSRFSRFPFTKCFLIFLTLSAIRAQTQDRNQIAFGIIGEQSTSKLIALLISAITIVAFEYYINIRKGLFNQMFLSKFLDFTDIKKENRFSRFMIILISINLLTWINLTSLQNIASNIYSFYRIGPLYPQFADLRTTLFGISCKNVNQIGDYISCGDRGNDWTYPTILLKIRTFSPDPAYANVLLPTFLILISISIFFLISHFPTVYFLPLILFFSLPPFVIAIERGNLDVIIFLFLVLILLMTRQSQISKLNLILISITLAIGSFLKFYPLIGIVCILFLVIRNVKRIGSIAPIVISAICLISLLFLSRDILFVQNYEIGDLSGSIGLKNIVALAIGLKDTTSVKYYQLLLVLVILMAIFFKTLWKSTHFYSKLGFNQRLEVLVTSSIATFPWLTTTNYYYRLILIWPVIFSICRLAIDRKSEFKAILEAILFPMLLGFILVFRTFAVVQNLVLVPVYLLFFVFMLREILEIKLNDPFKFR